MPAESVLRVDPSPYRRAALERIEWIRPDDYARTRNHLTGAVTRLSADLTHGVVTCREVLAGVLAHQALPVQHKLVFELGWREFFRHVWAREGDGILQSLHPGPRPDDHYPNEVPADVRQARTGVPVIDQAVRCLYETGYLHNHARMWLASYLVHLRQVHWRAGADWMVAHLLDGDLASNHLSWQWVAGTGSHKPYLFNAENVARFAPPAWHSAGTVIDQSYDALEAIARGLGGRAAPDGSRQAQPHPGGLVEPATHAVPPAALGLSSPAPDDTGSLRDQVVWLAHPWALRAPPAHLPAGARVIGIYLREFHEARPWSGARWHWVDAAMAQMTSARWYLDLPGLKQRLAGAAEVHSVDDPHLRPWLGQIAQLDPAPALFAPIERPCTSFSQWWTRATRGLRMAQELL